MRHTDYQPARNRWAFAADLAWLLTVLVHVAAKPLGLIPPKRSIVEHPFF